MIKAQKVYGVMLETKNLYIELHRRELSQEPRYDSSGFRLTNFQFRVVGQRFELVNGVPTYKGLYIQYV